MKKKIAILGSTGSIGKNLLNILKKEKKFKILLLTGHKNYITLLNQANEFKVRNIIITDPNCFKLLKSKTKGSYIKVYNNFESLHKIFKKKIDYVMSSITGVEGLKPTLEIIKHTKKIAIANKESIICAWNLIQNELKKYNSELMHKDFIVTFSKCDLLDNELKVEFDKEIKKKFKGIPYCMISAIDEFGLTELKDLIWRILNTTDE